MEQGTEIANRLKFRTEVAAYLSEQTAYLGNKSLK